MLDKTQGVIQDVAGKVQDAIGSASGEMGAQVAGKARRVAGKVQQTYGEAVSGARDAASSNPLMAIALASAVGFVFGALWSKRD